MPEMRKAEKVGLLTLPLSTNYGGILQMIALYDAIKQEGALPVLLDKRARPETLKAQLSPILARIPFQDVRGTRSRAKTARKHRNFFEAHVAQRSKPVRSGRDLTQEVERLGLSSVVVGSDQVWRVDYQKDAEELNYFLGFGRDQLRRVAYAASFGHGTWTFPKRTEDIRNCLSRFDAISVREKSGQDILADTFGRDDAKFVLDPTLLHDAAYYDAMMSQAKSERPYVLVYVLDRQEEARQMAEKIANKDEPLEVRVLSPSARDFTSIPDWLAAFKNAEFVVTDSYHGSIFSIIFERPFLTLLNSQRGLDRFTSLFEALKLTERGLTDWDGHIPPAASTQPDFTYASKAIAQLRKTSRAFLRTAVTTTSGTV